MYIEPGDKQRIEQLREHGDACLGKAQVALEASAPITTREWFDAADVAFRAARDLESSYRRDVA